MVERWAGRYTCAKSQIRLPAFRSDSAKGAGCARARSRSQYSSSYMIASEMGQFAFTIDSVCFVRYNK